MSRLFVSLYLDEDVSVLVGTLLRSRGYDVLTTQAAGNVARSDPEQLAFAASRKMAIVTHNRNDYLKLSKEYLANGRTHSGTIIAVRRSPYEIARRLLSLLDTMTADEMDNQLLYV